MKSGWFLRLLASVLFTLALAVRVHAQELTYSGIDSASVRVLALGDVELVEVKTDSSKTVKLAAPIGGHGSGFIVNADGLVVTAAHVVDGARVLAVHIPGVMGPVPAEVIEADSLRDFALLRIPGQYTHVAQLAPEGSKLSVRQTVFAIGYPLDATRPDPQSTRGAVSGLLPDGRLQLGISVNPGNSGGPVIDEQELVHGIIVTRSDVEHGEIGLAGAVPVSAFRAAVESARLKGVTPEQAQRLSAESQRKLADLVSLMAHEGPSILRGSVDLEGDEARLRRQQVTALYKQMPDSPEATLLTAAFFWNRYIALKLKGKDGSGALDNAKKLLRAAIKMDKKVARSPFAKHVLDPHARQQAEGVDVRPPGAERANIVDLSADALEVKLEAAGTSSVVYYVHEAGAETNGLDTFSINGLVYRRLCEAPCSTMLAPGSYNVGLGLGNRKPVPAGTIHISEDSTVVATYKDASGARTGGTIILVASAVTGIYLLATGLQAKCNTVNGSCENDGPRLLVGTGILIGGGVLAWVLSSSKDGGSVEIGPFGMPRERAAAPHAQPSRHPNQFARQTPVTGGQLVISF